MKHEPDLGVLLLIRGKDGFFPLLYFVEVDLGTETPTVFAKKLTDYDHWYKEVGDKYLAKLYRQYGYTIQNPSYRLLITTRARRDGGTDFDRLQRLYNQALPYPTDSRRRLAFTTDQAIEQARPINQILTAPIWSCPKHTAHLCRPLINTRPLIRYPHDDHQPPVLNSPRYRGT